MAGGPSGTRPFGTAHDPSASVLGAKPLGAPPRLVGRSEASPGFERPKEGEKSQKKVAEDMLSADHPEHKEIQGDPLFTASDEELLKAMTTLFGLVSRGRMSKVSAEMVARFFLGTGGPTHYKSKVLNEEIQGTTTFRVYDEAFQEEFDKRIVRAGYDLTKLAVIGMDDLDFSNLWQQATGLGVTIHQVHATEARVSRFTFDPKAGTWDGVFHYTLYDHFGLDWLDVVKAVVRWMPVPPILNGFKAWYILQHYRKAKPFVTEANITVRKWRPVPAPKTTAQRPSHLLRWT